MADIVQPQDEHRYPEPAVAWRAVAVLTALYWFGTLDRQIVALLLPMIKADLQLTDSQASLLPGLAFGLAFMILSLPVGWLVDRIGRRAILCVGVLTWSMAAMGSGLSRTFPQLFTARLAVGGSEATINPTAYSLLSDFFRPSRLTLPMSIFNLGGNLGSGTSFMIGGLVIGLVSGAGGVQFPLIGHLNGWQAAFVITGLPGVFLACLVWIFPEPVRRKPADTSVANASSFSDLGRQYQHYSAFYVLHNLAIAMIMAFAVGLQSWNSAYLSRAFDWPLELTGYWLGLGQILCALLGLWFHGWMVDRLFSTGRHDAHLIYLGATCLLACPFAIAAYLVPSAIGMVVFYSIAWFLVMAFSAIGPAALQIATPSRLRGKATAVYMIVLSIIGTILGPIIVAGFTDYIFMDEAKLGWSMASFGGLSTLLAALCCWWGRAPMRRAVLAQIGGSPDPVRT